MLARVLSLASDLLIIITLLLFMTIVAGNLPAGARGGRHERSQVVGALASFAWGTHQT